MEYLEDGWNWWRAQRPLRSPVQTTGGCCCCGSGLSACSDCPLRPRRRAHYSADAVDCAKLLALRRFRRGLKESHQKQCQSYVLMLIRHKNKLKHCEVLR